MSLELKEQYEKIYAFCYFKVHNVQVAEDITQETFLKYFETTQYLEKGKNSPFCIQLHETVVSTISEKLIIQKILITFLSYRIKNQRIT